MKWFRRLWEVPEGGKVADRPHPLTLLVGLLGPVTAILAITFTFMGYRLSTKSLETSQESLRVSQESLRSNQQGLKIAQRAYLTARTPIFELAAPPNIAEDSRIILFGYDLTNVGNTPARINDVSVDVSIPLPFVEQGAKYAHLERTFSTAETSIGRSVAGGDTTRLFHNVWINVSPYGLEVFRRGETGNMTWPIVTKVRISYADVFMELHEDEWCWRVSAGPGKLEGSPC